MQVVDLRLSCVNVVAVAAFVITRDGSSCGCFCCCLAAYFCPVSAVLFLLLLLVVRVLLSLLTM